MSAAPARPALRDILPAIDVSRAAAALDALERDPPPPWFVRVLVGLGTWIGAVLIGVFLVATRLLEAAPVRLVLGAALLWAARAARVRLKGDLAVQLTLVASIGGQGLILAFVSDVFRGEEALLATFIALQVLAILAIPDATHRFLSAGGAVVAAAALAHELGVPGGVEGVAILSGALFLASWLLDGRVAVSSAAAHHRPVAYGVACALLGLVLVQAFEGGPGQASPVAGSAGYFLLLAALIASALAESGRGVASPAGVLAIVAAGLVAALTYRAPAVPAALLVAGVGHLRRERMLVALGAVGLGAALSRLYYALDTSLLAKSATIGGTGVILLGVRALAGRLLRDPAADGEAGAARAPRRLEPAAVAIVAATLAALGGPALLVVQKERLLASGATVLLQLRPVDPRSLMQGDYMRLDYAVKDAIPPGLDLPRDGCLVLALDERGVASFGRLDDGATPLGPREQRLRFRCRGERSSWRGRLDVRLGAESFFFEEGRAAVFDGARYGELRVAPSGESVLVGLRDAGLMPLGR